MLWFKKKEKENNQPETQKKAEAPVVPEEKIKTIPAGYYNVRGPVLVEGWKEVEEKALARQAAPEKKELSEKEKQKLEKERIRKQKELAKMKEKEAKLLQKRIKEQEELKRGKKPSKIRNIIIGVVVFCIIAIITLGIFLLTYTPIKKQAAPTPANVNIAPVPTPPVNEPTPAPTPPLTEDKSIFKDTDGDGLSDLEEEEIYHTDIASPDTDGDGYPDGLEVVNDYNPTGFAPQKLLPTGLVKEYSSSISGFYILYPAAWDYQEVGIDVVFTSDIDETIKVAKDNNPINLKASDVVAKEYPEVSASQFEKVYQDNLLKITNKDLNMAYVQNSSETGPIYIISLIKEDKTKKPNFSATFLMMVKGFKIL